MAELMLMLISFLIITIKKEWYIDIITAISWPPFYIFIYY